MSSQTSVLLFMGWGLGILHTSWDRSHGRVLPSSRHHTWAPTPSPKTSDLHFGSKADQESSVKSVQYLGSLHKRFI